jgi:hypothetical protein
MPVKTLRPGEMTAAQLEQDAATAPPVVAQATAIAGVAKALGGGPLQQGFLGGLLAVGLHSYVDADDLVPRVAALERAMLSADEHNAWVQSALVALGEQKPIPAPPYRRMAPP